MNDLTDRLARLDGSAPSPTEGTVASDLTRARAALGRQRRTRAAVAGVGLTLGVGAALGVVVAVNAGGDPAPTYAGPSSADPGVDLVAYTGAQPEGFLLAKVPEGYQLQGSDSFVLTLAKPGDDSHPLDFEDKVVIMLESQDAQQQLGAGRDVTVNGEPGVLKGAPGETRTLRYFQGEHLVLIQVWEDIDLTDEQIVELAEATTVTGEVEAGVG